MYYYNNKKKKYNKSVKMTEIFIKIDDVSEIFI